MIHRSAHLEQGAPIRPRRSGRTGTKCAVGGTGEAGVSEERAMERQMSDPTEIYRELDAARMEHQGLATVNTYSLDTPEKRVAWDVAYEGDGTALDMQGQCAFGN